MIQEGASHIPEFLATASNDVLEFLGDVADEMSSLFGITRAEAVARINAQWPDQEFLERSDLVLHEDEHYWSLFIYYEGEIPDWRPDADRSSWQPKRAPPKDSGFWPRAY